MKKLLVAGIISALFWSCQPKPDANDLVRKLAVITDYDNTVDFTKYSTYSLSLDTLSYFNNSDPNPADTLVVDTPGSGQYVDLTINRINDKMTAAGYSKVFKKQLPDLKVYVFIVENINVYQSYSYTPYGYGYGYGFGYGYGYGGSYYPSVSETDEAKFYIEIFDLKNLSGGKPKLIWYCEMGDLVNSLNLGNPTLVTPYIDQAFTQSPYLKQ
jgi:hypothetical protein